ncbi:MULTISPECIES: LptF/LptG family permease [unclassified Rhizobium]|uniref:LptF/LptG family permease n=1 Tax=unclassified Rhizobium TaxID=2613769 RepID=UPI001ADA5666|nr:MULTISPECIES: LptF/LptG family permease [unclassified Rhizobium]MBO9123373.1 LptF/LptG family permease [Rhizobium sp. 16-488-2b]MBO9173905.1 LptF/LptG family permease [Rhizobium sp. 16-488-2a]
MKLLETYILRRVGQMFLVALLPVLAIIWTTQVLQRINLVTDSGQSVGSFAKLATLILPSIIPVVLPFALVIGVTQTLTTMNNDSELAVIDAAGARRSIIWRPIIILAAVISAFSFLVDNVVEPKAKTGARQMIAAAYADLLSTVIEEKNFRQIDTGLYVQISERLAGRVLKGLFVVDERDPAFQLIYYAREGAVDEKGTSLIMHDGEVHRKTTTGDVSIIRFDSYSFDLSDLTQNRGQSTLRASDRELPFLLSPDPEDKDYIAKPGSYRAELHRRLTDWMLPLVFSLISLAIAGDARSHREARLHPMVSALVVAFAVRWATFYAANQVESKPIFIGILYALPLGISAMAIASLILHKRISLLGVIGNWIAIAWRKLQQRLPRSAGGDA